LTKQTICSKISLWAKWMFEDKMRSSTADKTLFRGCAILLVAARLPQIAAAHPLRSSGKSLAYSRHARRNSPHYCCGDSCVRQFQLHFPLFIPARVFQHTHEPPLFL
jgi:hypothetical protein